MSSPAWSPAPGCLHADRGGCHSADIWACHEDDVRYRPVLETVRLWHGACACKACHPEGETTQPAGEAAAPEQLVDEPPPAGRDALIKAIRAFMVDMPNHQPNGPAEALILRLSKTLKGEGTPAMARQLLAEYCTAEADRIRALRIAAETYFGLDFKAPQGAAPAGAPAPEQLGDEAPPAPPAEGGAS